MDRGLILLCAILLMTALFAAAPVYASLFENQTIMIQLYDDSGNLLKMTQKDLTLRVYDVYEGGSHLYEKSHTGTTDMGGWMAINLADIGASLDYTRPYYLGVWVDGGEMTPRINLTMSTMSKNSDLWDGLDTPADLNYKILLTPNNISGDFSVWNGKFNVAWANVTNVPGNITYKYNATHADAWITCDRITGGSDTDYCSDATGGGGGGDGSGNVTSNSTAGYIPRFTNATNLASSNIYFDEATGRIGIGTISPSSPLHVRHPTADTLATLESDDNAVGIELIDDDYSWLVYHTANDFTIYDVNQNQPRMVVYDTTGDFDFNSGDVYFRNSDGNVGIGTSDPEQKLVVVGDLNVTGSYIGTIHAVSADYLNNPITINWTTNVTNKPVIVSSVDGVSNNEGDIDLIAGANMTITPNDGADTITLACNPDIVRSADYLNMGINIEWTNVTSQPDIVSSIADVVNDEGNIAISADGNITITANDANNTITFRVDPSGFHVAKADYLVNGLNIEWANITQRPQVLASVDGVANDAGDVDFIAGENITITPDNSSKTITFSVAVSDLNANQSDYWDDLDTPADLNYKILVYQANISDGIQIPQSNISTGITLPWGNVSSQPNIISSIEGVINDEGNIDLVEGGNVTITANDGENTITFSVPVSELTSNQSDFWNDLDVPSDLNYKILISQSNISTGITLPWGNVSSQPNIVSSVDGVTNDEGDIDFVAGGNITITPDDGSDTVTFSVNPLAFTVAVANYLASGLNLEWANLTGRPQLVGLIEGVANDTGNIELSGTNITITGNNSTKTVSFVVDPSGFHVATADYLASGLNIEWDNVTSQPNIVSSVDGVTNDEGDVDFVAGGNITITPDDGEDMVTFEVDPSGFSVAYASQAGYLASGLNFDAANITSGTMSVERLPSNVTYKYNETHADTWITCDRITGGTDNDFCVDISGSGATGLWVNGVSYTYLNESYNQNVNISGIVFVLQSTGRIGVKTESPSADFTVNGTLAATNIVNVTDLNATNIHATNYNLAEDDIPALTASWSNYIDGSKVSGPVAAADYLTTGLDIEWSNVTSQPSIVSSINSVTNDEGDIEIHADGNITITSNDANDTITLRVDPSSFSVAYANQAGYLTSGLNIAWSNITDQPNIVSSVDGVANDEGNVDFVAGGNITITPDDGANTVTFEVDPSGFQVSRADSADYLNNPITVDWNSNISNIPSNITYKYNDTHGAVFIDCHNVTGAASDLCTITSGGQTTILPAGNITAGNFPAGSFGFQGELDMNTNSIIGIVDINGTSLYATNIDATNYNLVEGDIPTLSGTWSGALDASKINGIVAQCAYLTSGLNIEWSNVTSQPTIVSSVDGVSNDEGNIDLVAGANMTITPSDGADTITFACNPDIVKSADYLNTGLSFDAANITSGTLSVERLPSNTTYKQNETHIAGWVPCENITGADSDFCNDATGSGSTTSLPASNITGGTFGNFEYQFPQLVNFSQSINVTDDVNATNLYVTSIFANSYNLAEDDIPALTASWSNTVDASKISGVVAQCSYLTSGLNIEWSNVTSQPDIISSIGGVANDEGNVAISADGNITITTNDANNTITFRVDPSGFRVAQADYLTAGLNMEAENITSGTLSAERLPSNVTYKYNNTHIAGQISCENITGGSDGDFCTDSTGGGADVTQLPSSNISSGIFGSSVGSGDYDFPGNLNVTSRLNVSGFTKLSNEVGIGAEPNPSIRLYVNGSSDSPAMKVEWSGFPDFGIHIRPRTPDINWYTFVDSEGRLIWRMNSTNLYTFSHEGKFGIGEPQPLQALVVVGNINVTGNFTSDIGAGNITSGIMSAARLPANVTYKYNNTHVAGWISCENITGSDSDFCSDATGSGGTGNVTSNGTAGYIPRFTNATNVADSVIFYNNGNIGIRTTAPAKALSVQGEVFINTTSATDTLLTINASTGHTGNLTEWRNATGAMVSVNATGGFSYGHDAEFRDYINETCRVIEAGTTILSICK